MGGETTTCEESQGQELFLMPVMPRWADRMVCVCYGRADGAFLVAQRAKNLLSMQETWVQDPLEEGMATHSSILAWRIPQTEEAGRTGYSPEGHKESNTTEQLTW